jgi:hypothetical protein
MKARRWIIGILTLFTAVFYLLPATLFQVPGVQRYVAQAVSGYLESKTGAPVRIRQVDFRFLNQLILKDVYMEDLQGDTLLNAKRIAAGFEFFPLLNRQFRFRSVQVHTFVLHLNRTSPDSPLNINHLFFLFKNKNETETANADFRIEDISLRGGRVSYRVDNQPQTPGLLNFNDMNWSEVRAKIRVNYLAADSLSASVKSLSAREQSGFDLQSLSFDLLAGAGKAKVNRLKLQLPHSEVHLDGFASGYRQADRLRFDVQIEDSHFHPDDLRAVFPTFARLDEPVSLRGRTSSEDGDIRLSDFSLTLGSDARLAFDATIRLPDLKAGGDWAQTPIAVRISDAHFTEAGVEATIDRFGRQGGDATDWKTTARRIGSLSLQGEASGTLNDLSVGLRLETEVGNLQADGSFEKENRYSFKGKIKTNGIALNRLLANEDWGNARFELDLNTEFKDKNDFRGTIEAVVDALEYETFRYENLALSGDFSADGFNASLNAESANGRLAAASSFASEGPRIRFSAEATDLLPDRLFRIGKYSNPKLSFVVDADLTGNHPDNLAGNLRFLHLSFANEAGVCALDSFVIESQGSGEQRQLHLRSDLLTGEVAGRFSFSTLQDALKQSLSAYLPSLFPPSAPLELSDRTAFRWDFTIRDTRTLSTVLQLPVTICEPSRIEGEYDSEGHRFQLNGAFPLFLFGASTVETGTIDLSSNNDSIELKIKGVSLQRKGNKLALETHARAMRDSVHTTIRWNSENGSKTKGALDFTTQFAYEEGPHPLSAAIRIQPSEIVFNDSIWTLTPTTIDYREGRWLVDRFLAQHNRQKITLEGAVSKNASDRIQASLKEVDLDYVFRTLNIKALTFGGIATGYVTASDLFATRKLSAQLAVRDFSFNDAVFGNMDLHGRWNDEQQGVEIKGNIVKNDTTSIGVDGFLYPLRQEISILFDAHRGNAAFLRKYMNTIAKDFSGQITGKLRLFGHWNDPTVEGDAWVDQGSFGIEFLNARYTFSDWVRLTPDEITIRNTVLQDAYGNKAIASGSIRHHLFSDFSFSTQLSYENFLVFNATPRTNPLFYGRLFGTGVATIQGTEDLVNIDVSLQNNESSTITLNLMKQPDVKEYDFINFISKNNPQAPPTSDFLSERSSLPSPRPNLKTEIRTNLSINVNPEATLELIMDPATSDRINATGEGAMQIQYGTQMPLRVFGNYRIDRGAYNFSFQQAFFRTFHISEGSSINFRGDPFMAALDIKAAYTVSANLGDLDQQLVQQTETGRRLSARDNIPVNCVLLLSGPLEQPVIQFDLELPGATSDTERQVKSYIRTDDMMNRQMIYLLLMGRFYTAPEYAQNNTGYNNDLSLLTSTLSSYITTLLGNLSDKFQVGTKFHQTYEESGTNTELELLLSSTLLNNRLIINGNFGYIRNPYQNTLNDNIPLIGDFDIEYKLTKKGDIRLKGFNRYNYRNYFSLTPEMIRGFGILFRKDFNTVNDLFGKRRPTPSPPLPATGNPIPDSPY